MAMVLAVASGTHSLCPVTVQSNANHISNSINTDTTAAVCVNIVCYETALSESLISEYTIVSPFSSARKSCVSLLVASKEKS